MLAELLRLGLRKLHFGNLGVPFTKSVHMLRRAVARDPLGIRGAPEATPRIVSMYCNSDGKRVLGFEGPPSRTAGIRISRPAPCICEGEGSSRIVRPLWPKDT